MPASTKTIAQFPQVATRTKSKKPVLIDPAFVKVEHNVPLPAERRVNGKYDHIFEALKPGSCITCEPHEVSTMQALLRRWLQRNKITDMKLTQVLRCDDGKGRVWLHKKDTK